VKQRSERVAVSAGEWGDPVACYFLPGRDVPLAPARRLFGAIWVDGFFAISGFLITASWLGKPRVRD
jgi:peptidoglycan/LPS O-acetylase OafA/YrhL